MNVTTATPVEIDTRLAELYRQAGAAEANVLAAAVGIHYALDEKPRYVTRTRKTWPTTDTEAVEAARARGDEKTALRNGGRPFSDLVAKYDAAVAALEAIKAEAAPLNDEYDRRPWSRFFVVQNNGGHIHSSMGCSTCNRGLYATQFGWNPELSGLSEADAVAKLGPALCTVCFPSAPVEWTAGADKKADQCDGSRKAPIEGSTKKTGMRRYGDCTKCTDRPLINGDGTVRAHKPKEPREQAAPVAEVAPAPVAPVAEVAPAATPEDPADERDQADEQATPAPAAVVVDRHPFTPTPGRRGPEWTYTYRVDGGPLAQYGSGLASLRSMLKTRFPGARVVESWKDQQPTPARTLPNDTPRQENPAMLLPEIPATLTDLDEAIARYSDATHGPKADEDASRAAAIAVAEVATAATLGHQVADLLDAIADRRAGGAPAGVLLDQVVDALTRLAGTDGPPAPGDAVVIPARNDGKVWTVEAIRTHSEDGHPYLALTRKERIGTSGTALGLDMVRVVRRAADRDDLHEQAPHLSAYETHRVPVDGGTTAEDLRAIAYRVGVSGAGTMRKNELVHVLNRRLEGARD